jgi:putative ABC transport system ATP-binding protein
MGLLEELHQAGSTICMVTHNDDYAKKATRTIRLFDGRVVDEHKAAAVATEEEARA